MDLHSLLKEKLEIDGIVDNTIGYLTEWGEEDIMNLSHIEREHKKDDLQSIIKDEIKDFKQSITLNDIIVYNEIKRRKLSGENATNFATKSGSLNLLKYYRALGGALPSLAIGAQSGRKEIIDYLVINGASDYFNGLVEAISSNSDKILDQMIDLSIKNEEYPSIEDKISFYIFCIRTAINNNNNYAFQRFMSLIPEDRHLGVYKNVILDAAKQGDKKLVDFLLEKGVTDYTRALYGAAKGGHKDLFDYFLDKHDRKGLNNEFINILLEDAAEGGNMDIVNELLDLGASEYKNAIQLASLKGHMDIVMKLFFRDTSISLNRALWYAAAGGHFRIIKFLLDHGAGDHQNAIRVAENKNHPTIAQFIRQYTYL